MHFMNSTGRLNDRVAIGQAGNDHQHDSVATGRGCDATRATGHFASGPFDP